MPRPTVDFYASLPHFHRHLAPIADALRARDRVGVRCWSRGGECEWPVFRLNRDTLKIAVVASYDDAQRFTDRPTIYVEHGAGQQYVGIYGSGYAGAPNLGHVVLFIAPNETVAERWRRAYPHARAEVVGAPALDVFFRARQSAAPHDGSALSSARRPVVAFAFHWRCSVCPETMPALPHYAPALPGVVETLRANGSSCVGTSHPRARGPLRRMWTELGVTYTEDPDEILRTASVLVCDNSSLMYEAAALGIPVVALNAPWYRRDVEHGMRYWSHVPGLQCDEPDDLLDVIARACAGEGEGVRVRAAERAYAFRDECAAERAAIAIETAVRSGRH